MCRVAALSRLLCLQQKWQVGCRVKAKCIYYDYFIVENIIIYIKGKLARNLSFKISYIKGNNINIKEDMCNTACDNFVPEKKY